MKKAFFLATFFAFALAAFAQNPRPVDAQHAEKMGRVWVQDHKGRCKPLNTYSSEIMRKLARTESLFGQTADQIVLGMASDPASWYAARLFKIGMNEAISKKLGVTAGKWAAYNEFFDEKGAYKFRDDVRAAYALPQRDRGTLEKNSSNSTKKSTSPRAFFRAVS